jgi:hypothetical protein
LNTFVHPVGAQRPHIGLHEKNVASRVLRQDGERVLEQIVKHEIGAHRIHVLLGGQIGVPKEHAVALKKATIGRHRVERGLNEAPRLGRLLVRGAVVVKDQVNLRSDAGLSRIVAEWRSLVPPRNALDHARRLPLDKRHHDGHAMRRLLHTQWRRIER